MQNIWEAPSNTQSMISSIMQESVAQARVNITMELPTASLWMAIPFVLLLGMIATGPLLFLNFWHKHYPKISIGLAALVIVYYYTFLDNKVKPVETIAEYVQFITVIIALYMVTGGIAIKIRTQPTPILNIIFLCVGALFANLIGTTGASMLFIRPYLGLNKYRIKIYHVVFFIFIVSNVGGALTPIGDPPLFIGFIKGIPFTWTLKNNFFPWLTALSCLFLIFYIIDKQNVSTAHPTVDEPSEGGIVIIGGKNILWLGVII